MKDGRWVTIAESQFAHEKQGLEAVKQTLPDAEPFRAWANFELRDNRGRWHEVDLLVLARDTLYLVELKHYRGILTGNDHRWRRNNRTEDRRCCWPAARPSTSPRCSKTPSADSGAHGSLDFCVEQCRARRGSIPVVRLTPEVADACCEASDTRSSPRLTSVSARSPHGSRHASPAVRIEVSGVAGDDDLAGGLGDGSDHRVVVGVRAPAL